MQLSRPGGGGPHGRAGVTLVEILVVLALIGVLIALTTPRVQDAVARRAQAGVRADLGRLGAALTEAYGTKGYFPGDPVTSAAWRTARMDSLAFVPTTGLSYLVAIEPDGQAGQAAVRDSANGVQCQLDLGATASGGTVTCP